MLLNPYRFTQSGVSYLLKADFTAADQTFTDGQLLDTESEGVQAGSLTVAGNAWEISSTEAKYTVPSGSPTDESIKYLTGITRTRGNAIFDDFKVDAAGTSGGISLRQTTTDQWADFNRDAYFYCNATGDTIIGGGTNIAIATLASPTSYNEYCIILGGYSSDVPWNGFDAGNSDGVAYFIRENGESNWKLAYRMSGGTTATLYPFLIGYKNTSGAIIYHDNIRIPDADLSSVLEPSFIDTSVTTGDTFTHTADCFIESHITTLPSSGNYDIEFRRQDDNNKWILRVTSAGAVSLVEVVAGTPTTRASSGTMLSGEAVKLVADDDDIVIYENDGNRAAYASATNFKTATSGKVTFGSGSIAHITGWARGTGGEYSALDGY